MLKAEVERLNSRKKEHRGQCRQAQREFKDGNDCNR